MKDISKLESRLWEAADQLRANSKLTASQYSMPVLGLIFLRHAYNRFSAIIADIDKGLPCRQGRKRAVTKDDFLRAHAIFLPREAQYDYLLSLTDADDIAGAINKAMKLIEDNTESLGDVLPKNYNIFEKSLLRDLLRIFNDEALQKASGDVFGRIYEYFLNKFAMTGAQEGGEFFTPMSLVQMIVNVIEPDHGIVCDIACGSAGMFVQTGHFIEHRGGHASRKVTFYGQEKADLNIKLARMNLAVHGLEGKIIQGNTFYEDNLDIAGKCDFVMANPPFNVDKVNADNTRNAGRLPFGLPGVNKDKAVSNGNYLWIQYFYSYLNKSGRAGFVMASSASDAGGKEKEVRQKLAETGHVDVIISIGTNFFYTRTLPCTLWFFDKSKPKDRLDKVLMLDARNVYHKLTRKINIFTDEQLKNLTSIVWLYRGQSDRFIALVSEYLNTIAEKQIVLPELLDQYHQAFNELIPYFDDFQEVLKQNKAIDPEITALIADYNLQIAELRSAKKELDIQFAEFSKAFSKWKASLKDTDKSIKNCISASKAFEPVEKVIKSLIKALHSLYKQTEHTIKAAETKFNGSRHDEWNSREVRKSFKTLEELQSEPIEVLKELSYFHKQSKWLLDKFPKAEFEDIEGLCKLVDRAKIEASDWSLTPGRYVGVAPRSEDEDMDIAERLEEIHAELAQLNEEAIELAQTIQDNYERLDI